MNVGMICYASVGGSGVVAAELGRALARAGHGVHFFSPEPPFRLGRDEADGLRFHKVHTPTYPPFREPQYLLSLANTIVQTARAHELDVLHAHYAVPHATAAFLAREVLRARVGAAAPRVVTTLHGTDITLLGSDPSFSAIVAFSIEQSDAVTAVSRSLSASTYAELAVTRDIAVIPNFVDCAVYHRGAVPELRRRFAPDPRASLVIHVSNFRPVKRVDVVMRVFDRIRRRVDARLLLVGEGPELQPALSLARETGTMELVSAIGEHEDVIPLLSIADLLLLPSAQESFGLAALEAMACEVPVVASNVGGLPEVIEHGVSGCLHATDDVDGMAESAVQLLTDGARRRAVTDAALRRVRERFCAERVVPMYVSLYEKIKAA